jgi:nitroreductase
MLLMLKAAELGLDTLVMGLRDADALRRELNIPENETIVDVIAVGKRAADPARPPRKELDDIMKIY